MSLNWIAVLKAAPWKHILAAAPGTARAVNALWRRSRHGKSTMAPPRHGSDMEQQLEEMRLELMSAAQVIQSLAGQNAHLARAIDRLRRRMWLLSAALVVLAASLFYLR